VIKAIVPETVIIEKTSPTPCVPVFGEPVTESEINLFLTSDFVSKMLNVSSSVLLIIIYCFIDCSAIYLAISAASLAVT
jgi:hypothetical protein